MSDYWRGWISGVVALYFGIGLFSCGLWICVTRSAPPWRMLFTWLYRWIYYSSLLWHAATIGHDHDLAQRAIKERVN